MGNSTGNADNKATKTGENDKTKEKRWNISGQKGKHNTSKNNDSTWGNKPERPPKRNRLKQFQTHNVPTYDVGITNSTNKENYSTFISASSTRAKQDAKM